MGEELVNAKLPCRDQGIGRVECRVGGNKEMWGRDEVVSREEPLGPRQKSLHEQHLQNNRAV